MSENPSDLKVLLLRPQLRVQFAVIEQQQGEQQGGPVIFAYRLDPLNSAVLSFLAFIDKTFDIAWPLLAEGFADSSFAGVRRLNRETGINRHDIVPVIVSMQRGSLVIDVGWAIAGAGVAALAIEVLINLLGGALWDLLKWISGAVIQALSGSRRTQLEVSSEEIVNCIAQLAKEISQSLEKGQKLLITADLQEPGRSLSVAILDFRPPDTVFNFSTLPTLLTGSIVEIDDANERVGIQWEGDRSDIVWCDRRILRIREPQRFVAEKGRTSARIIFEARLGIRYSETGPFSGWQVLGVLAPSSGSTGLDRAEVQLARWLYKAGSALKDATVNYLVLRPRFFGRTFTSQEAGEFIDSLVSRGILKCAKKPTDEREWLRLNWGEDYDESGATKRPQKPPLPVAPTIDTGPLWKWPEIDDEWQPREAAVKLRDKVGRKVGVSV